MMGLGYRRLATKAALALGAAGLIASHAGADAGDALFRARCQVCHRAQPGPSGIGPNLSGVSGRKAGSVAGYSYSNALRGSGKTWNKTTLDAWLANNKGLVPGNKMAAPPVTDAGQRAALVTYLLSLKG